MVVSNAHRKTLRAAILPVIERLEDRRLFSLEGPLVPSLTVLDDATDSTTRLDLIFDQSDDATLQLEWKTPWDHNFHIFDGTATGAGTALSPLVVTGLTPNSSYDFRLRAVKNGLTEHADDSGTTTEDVQDTSNPPAPPTNISVSPGSGQVFVNFDGSYGSSLDGISSDDYYVSFDAVRANDPYHLLDTLSGYWFTPGLSADNTISASTLSSGADYAGRITITEKNSPYGSATSELISFTSGDTPVPKVELTSLPASGGNVTVSWTGADSEDETIQFYAIDEYGVLLTNWGHPSWGSGDTPASDGSATFAAPPAGSQIFAVVNASVSSTYGYYYLGDYSNFVDGQGDLVAPAAPSDLALVQTNPNDKGDIRLTWKNNSNDEKGFRILKSANGGSSYVELARTEKDVTSYIDRSDQLYGQTYKYKVVAYKDDAENDPPILNSADSNVVSYSLDMRDCSSCKDGISPSGQSDNPVGPPLGSPLGLKSQPVPNSNGNDTPGYNASDQIFIAKLDGDEDTMTVVQGNTQWFFTYDDVLDEYVEAYGGMNSLSGGSGGFVFTDSAGNKVYFAPGFEHTSRAVEAKFATSSDAAGNTVEVSSENGDGNPLQIDVFDVNDVQLERWLYTYVSAGVNAGRPESVSRQVKIGATWTTVRAHEYTYYSNGDADGGTGDLKSIVVTDGANELSNYYYRYYLGGEEGGYAHRVKYSFGNESFNRVLAEYSVSNFDTLTDSEIEDFADSYTEYDLQGRIVLRTLQGEGCSTCAGGQGTYTYSYDESTNSAGANSWATKLTETLPDGNQTIKYFNADEQQMLVVEKNVTTGNMWGTFTLYDSDGRPILTALPSAVALPSSLATIEAYADLLHYTSGGYEYLSDNTGVVQLTEYYSSTTATTSAAGGVKGYFKESSIRKGESGTAIPQETRTYIERAGDTATIYPLASSTVYRSTGGADGQTTAYSYTWLGTSVQKASQTVTLPTVTTAQNGPNSADESTSYFDSFGRTIWTKDAEGYLTYSVYDADTGGLTKHVVDADPALISDSPITEPSRGGGLPTALHLATEYVVDSFGRTTKFTDANGNVTYTVYNDVNHEVRIYPAWDATAGKPLLPIEVSRQDLAGSYSESLTYAWTGTGGNSLPLNGDGTPAGTESANSAYAALQSLSRTYTSAGGQVSETRSYFNLNGLSYSTSSSLGTSGTHYYATAYDYDQRGQVKRTVAPTGTIKWTLYDSQGRIGSYWIGTNDAGAVNGDPTGGAAAGNNMVKVTEYEYDNGGVGDGNLTKITVIPGSGAVNRVSQSYYDWRNRLVASKSAVQSSETTGDNTHFISYMTLDNLGHPTSSSTFDGDNISVSDGNSDGVPDAPTSSLLRAYSTTEYDEQGRVYRNTTYGVDPLSGTISTYGLVSNVWFDHHGNVIKTSAPGSAVTKMEYDGAGRVTKTYITDGGGDSGWSDAGDLTGDIVLEQSESSYDANGNVILSTLRQAFHDNSGTGAIGDTSAGTTAARVYYEAAYYDPADRLIESVDIGTNGGSSYSRPGSAPARSSTLLRTSYSYDSAGLLKDITDPKGVITRTTYDALGRTKKTVENYVDGTPSAGDDRTTEYTYDGSSHVLTMTASNYDGSASTQTTQYVYGENAETLTSLTSSGTTVTATLSGHGYRVGETVFIKGAIEAAYNGAFKITGVTSTTFTYTAGSTPSASPATTTTSLTARRNHDIFSNDMLVATRYPDKSSGAASASEQETYTLNALGERKNKVDRAGSVHEYTYDVLGRLTADAVTTLGSGVDGTVRRLATAFNSAGQAYRFTSYTTATGSTVKNDVQREFNGLGQVTKEYQNFTGAVNTSTTEYVGYTYSYMTSGANHSRLIAIDYPLTYGMTLAYDYGLSGSLNDKIGRLDALKDGAQALEEYTYLGGGTIVERRHSEASANLTYIGTGPGDGGDKYVGLDRFGRIIDQRWDNTSSATDFDRLAYAYDENGNTTSRIHQLTTGTSTRMDQSYTYDGFNRITNFKRGTIASGTMSNVQRQQGWVYDALDNMTSVGEATTGTLSWTGRTYNKENQFLTITGATSTPTYDANGNTTLDSLNKPYTYDAWNRMIGGASSVPYEYDAVGRAVKKWATYRYFSTDWQVLMTTGGGGTAKNVQNVWSPAYIDGLVVRYRDKDMSLGTNGYEEHMYVMQDANWNVTGIIEAGATDTVVERYMYDPYGKPTYMNPTTYASITNGGNYEFANLLQDAAGDTNTRTMSFRNREYNWELMRWMQNDPAGFADGGNTYQFNGNNPVSNLDPYGLFKTGVHSYMTREAVKGLGMKEDYVEELIASNVWTDLHSLLAPSMHAQSDPTEWLSYFKKAFDDFVKERGCGPGEDKEIVHRTGQMLHILQDFYTHTNWVEGDSNEMLALYRHYGDEKRLPKDGKRMPGHANKLIPMDVLTNGVATFFNGITWYEGGETGPFDGSSDHYKYAADDKKKGRDYHIRTFAQSPKSSRPPRREAVGIHGAYERAYSDAANQSRVFLEHVKKRLQCECRKEIFGS